MRTKDPYYNITCIIFFSIKYCGKRSSCVTLKNKRPPSRGKETYDGQCQPLLVCIDERRGKTVALSESNVAGIPISPQAEDNIWERKWLCPKAM